MFQIVSLIHMQLNLVRGLRLSHIFLSLGQVRLILEGLEIVLKLLLLHQLHLLLRCQVNLILVLIRCLLLLLSHEFLILTHLLKELHVVIDLARRIVFD